MNIAYRAPATDRRLSLLLMALVHVVLVAAWQAVRTSPAPAPVEDAARSRILWIPLPRPALRDKEPAPRRKEAAAQPVRPHAAAVTVLLPVPQTGPVRAPMPAPADTAASAPAPGTAAPPGPNAEQILERARRDIGGIDKALRKENKPYIAAPLDSPQIRMRRKMEEAAALAPNRIWEAPKVEDLVNDTGDGARRSRVITGNGTYCITDRAPTTSIDMLEKHGKQRITSCPQHELPASRQEWRTLRD